MKPLLEVKALSKSYKTAVFRDVSFILESGSSIGIIGGNGSGKTTLLNIIAGLERADSGLVSVNASLGYVMQRDGLIERLSARDNLRFACELGGVKSSAAKQRIDELSVLCGLNDFLGKRTDRLSGGMRQRLNIASAMVHSPALLLLDEPSSGLDAKSRELLFALLTELRGRGVSLIIVSHYENELSELGLNGIFRM